jgi:cytochrome P450
MNVDGHERVTIEKSTPVIVPVQSIHMDPQHYNNPKVFDPDRFNPANGGIDHFVKQGVFLAFGTGPRTCLGKSFALLVIKVALVEVVKNFRVLQSAETKLPLEMTSRNSLNIPIGGVWAVFRPI